MAGKFRIGDQVVRTGDHNNFFRVGDVAEIVSVICHSLDGSDGYGVVNENIRLRGGPMPNGWYADEDKMVLFDPNKDGAP